MPHPTPFRPSQTATVVVSTRDGLSRAEADNAFAGGVGLLELRLDQFQVQTSEHVESEFTKFNGLPLLLTIRSKEEGGSGEFDDATRLLMFQRWLPYTGTVDVELQSAIFPQVKALARQEGALLVSSFHDFAKTPTAEALDEIVATAAAEEVDIIKIACYCRDGQDLRRLASVILRYPNHKLAIIGMGPHGLASRVFFAALGSVLTYACHGTPTAPGQLSWQETVAYLRRFNPSFR